MANHFERLARFDHHNTLALLAAHWGAPVDSLDPVAGGVNITYRFEANGQSGYLKISHAEGRDENDLLATHTFLDHLLTHNAPVNQPLLTRDGEPFAAVQQGEDRFLATAVLEAAGTALPETILPPEQWRAWGAALGQLHHAAHSYQPGGFRYMDWNEIWQELKTYLEPDDRFAWREFNAIDDFFQGLPRTMESYGLTHFDFRAGNMLSDGERITIIDFDGMVYHWWIADVARPFLEIVDRPLDQRRAALRGFIEGYRAQFELTDDWLKALPWFVRMKQMDLYAWDYAHWNPRSLKTKAEFRSYYQRLFSTPTEW